MIYATGVSLFRLSASIRRTHPAVPVAPLLHVNRRHGGAEALPDARGMLRRHLSRGKEVEDGELLTHFRRNVRAAQRAHLNRLEMAEGETQFISGLHGRRMGVRLRSIRPEKTTGDGGNIKVIISASSSPLSRGERDSEAGDRRRTPGANPLGSPCVRSSGMA